MKMLNTLEAVSGESRGAAAFVREGLSILLRVLYPVVPHTAWVLWNDLGLADRDGDILNAAWPTVDEAALARDEIELVLQVNGKVRGKVVVPASASEEEIRTRASAAPEVAKYGNGAPARFIKVVPGRLVNVVV